MNDLFGLYISYYIINSFEFIMVGVLLLIASIICVNLNKFNRNIKANNYYDLLVLFDFFDDFIKYSFMRKQNLVDQTIKPSATRIFKKKVSK
jgi:ABC-type transport system involved in multi-copper enzyme maturation permease subunit